MKSAKLKIVAVAMAAISSFGAAQAISASAFTYTLNSQYTMELQSTMNTRVARWKSSSWGTRFLPNKTWTEHVTSGTIVGGYYDSYIPGGYWFGQDLTGGKSFVRALAEDYFGTTIFMVFGGGSKEFAPRIGDQICISRNGETRYLFITNTTNGIKAAELVGGKIKYDRSYGVNNGAMTFNGNRWTVNNYLRPIKQGDANGDSYVYKNSYHNFSGDKDAFASYAKYGVPGNWGNVITAALTMNNDEFVTQTDYNTWSNNLGNTTYGRMNGSYGYVVSIEY